MEYFDRDFWKMTAGFLLIIAVGLAGVYLLNLYDRTSSGNLPSDMLEAGSN